MITFLTSNVFALGEGDYRIHDTIYDTFDFAADVLDFVKDTIFGAFGHVLGTVTFQAAYLGFLLWGVIKLVFTDLFTDIDKLLTGFFPLVGIVVAAVVTQFVGEILQLVDGVLFRRAGHHRQSQCST